VNSSEVNVLPRLDTQASGAESQTRGPSTSESCAKIKSLSFTVSKHARMYGELFEIVSDPFTEGDYVVVRAISGTDPERRTLHLPKMVLMGSEDRFLRRPRLAE
jgi:hypothetical protein